MVSEQSLTLALGGGGVKCYAHIGVLQALQALNIEIRGIAATSAGALIAALFASGRTPAEIKEIANNLNFRKLSRITTAESKLGS